MELFHVLNRGVDKRKIFLDDQDHFRFIHNLFEFNDKNSDHTSSYFFRQSPQSFDVGRRKIERKSRELLVDILAFCLMPNHYHLLLAPRVENGIPLFMKKLNGGFAKYFNERYERSGALFQGKYKRIEVADEAHFLYLPYYIHLNPLDMIAPEWRDGALHDRAKATAFLDSYRWSSHLDYAGSHNFPSVLNRELLAGVFGGAKGYEKRIKDFLRQFDFGSLKGVMLE